VQRGQQGDQLGVLAVTVVAVPLDEGQHLAHGVHHGQQPAGHLGVQADVAVTQPAEQVLAHVCHRFQAIETEKSAGSLDRVDGAENGREQLLVRRLFLQLDEVAIQSVQVLVAFHKEFTDQFVHAVHDGAFATG
jgi:hypothetical protein